jgi:hypothetical protein
MKPDRYELSNSGPQRLSDCAQRGRSRKGFSTWPGFVFGVLVLAIGVAITLVGTKTLRVNPTDVHAPYWVITVAGLCFAVAGFLTLGAAWKQLKANRQRREAARQHPNEPALLDYDWHPAGFEVSEWKAARDWLAGALGMTLFLSMFNWWAFGGQGNGTVKVVVTVFDLALVLMWWKTGQMLGRAFKFGHSRIVFTRFPYALGEPVIVRWQPSAGVDELRKGTFTLRFVREWQETTGTGKNRRTTVYHEELWSAKWLLEQPRRLSPKDDIELAYELPAEARSTHLTADQPLFWELEVKLDLPGLDFSETYLVPIYGGKTVPRIKPILLKT